MRATMLFTAAACAAALTACAGVPDAPIGPPDYALIPVEPSPRAALYADCIAQATANRSYGRAHDRDTELVVFTCTGAPARAFYEGLAARSAEVGSEWTFDGRTWRSTNRVQRDLFGADWCSTDPQTGHRCVISLNAGAFLRP